jgi:hypothetical protein
MTHFTRADAIRLMDEGRVNVIRRLFGMILETH